MDELDKWTEHAKEVLDFWPIAYYPFQMIKTESGAGLEDLCPEEEIKKDWEIVRGKVKEENANGYPMFMGYEWQGCGFDGDHNVFFLDNEQDMKHPMRYQELRDDYKDTEAIGIPHHVAYQLGSRGKNWATHDENFPRLRKFIPVMDAAKTIQAEWIWNVICIWDQEPVKPAMKEVWRLVFMLDVLHPVTTIMFLQHVTMERCACLQRMLPKRQSGQA